MIELNQLPKTYTIAGMTIQAVKPVDITLSGKAALLGAHNPKVVG